MVSKSSWNDFTTFNLLPFVYNKLRVKFGSSLKDEHVTRTFSSLISRGGLFLREVDLNFEKYYLRLNYIDILEVFTEFCVNIEKFNLRGFDPLDDSNNFRFYMDDVLKYLFIKNKNLKSVTINQIVMSGECLLSAFPASIHKQ